MEGAASASPSAVAARGRGVRARRANCRRAAFRGEKRRANLGTRRSVGLSEPWVGGTKSFQPPPPSPPDLPRVPRRAPRPSHPLRHDPWGQESLPRLPKRPKRKR